MQLWCRAKCLAWGHTVQSVFIDLVAIHKVRLKHRLLVPRASKQVFLEIVGLSVIDTDKSLVKITISQICHSNTLRKDSPGVHQEYTIA